MKYLYGGITIVCTMHVWYYMELVKHKAPQAPRDTESLVWTMKMIKYR